MNPVARVAVGFHPLNCRPPAIDQDPVRCASEGINQGVARVVASCPTVGPRLPPANFFDVAQGATHARWVDLKARHSRGKQEHRSALPHFIGIAFDDRSVVLQVKCATRIIIHRRIRSPASGSCSYFSHDEALTRVSVNERLKTAAVVRCAIRHHQGIVRNIGNGLDLVHARCRHSVGNQRRAVRHASRPASTRAPRSVPQQTIPRRRSAGSQFVRRDKSRNQIGLSQKSLIHVLLRRCLKSGHGIRWQRDWPCHLGKKFPAPTFDTDWSTYALFATCPVLVGAGTLGAAANIFAPLIVSVPLKCTTALSSAFVASSEFTYCMETGCPATPEPGVVRTPARFAGDVVGTTQYSVFTWPGPSWYTTV